MILKLKVSNFALIDDLEMTFEKGLTAMTGETGAGKSIILESLQLLFGKRSDATMVRHGESKATVFGVFELTDEQMSLLDLPKLIEVEREIDLQGRHNMRLNKEVTTLSKLKEVMQAIGHIHSQNDQMTLFDKSYYLTFVDQVDQQKSDSLLNEYLLKRSHYLDKKKHFESLKSKKAQSIEKQSFLEFQVQELKNYHLIPNEKETLEESIEKLKNYDKIMNQLRTAYELIEHEHFSIDQIYEASKAMDKIASLDKSYLRMSERLSQAYYDLDDVKSEIYQTIESLDFDEKEFSMMQDRLYDITKIEQKYQKTYTELIDYLHEIEEELLLITDYDHYLEEAKQTVDKAFKIAYEAGVKLSNHRKQLAKSLEKSVILELKDLDLDKASFDIVFEEMDVDASSLLESGIDQIEFYISLNEGEPVKPLAKVASGGERARFMFALRAIYAKSHHLSLLILDEIDIGISGKTAAKVANKMYVLSQTMQLIVITHLPQVAARANHHYGIFKQKEKERMVTRILKLNHDERIEMIAMMLSDEKLSHFAIEQAKMLLSK
ncbi:MAG: DNA repair protein RecN [Bacillota bacterium]|nr:MAG: DNA repair protein RecN [Bacillota bacterium]